MNTRFHLIAAGSAALTTIAACGLGGSGHEGSPTSRTSPATQVKFTEAIRSEEAATKACRVLVGDGTKQAEWLHSIPEGKTAAYGYIDAEDNAPSFACVIKDGKGDSQGSEFIFIRGRDKFDTALRRDSESATEPDRVASAWNEATGLGVLSDEVRTGRNTIATRDLEHIITKIG